MRFFSANANTIVARTSYVLFVLTLVVATLVEWRTSTDFSYHYIYGAWWFAAVIFVCGASAALIVFRALRKRKAALLLHLALLLILVGALVTKLFGVQGQIHLRLDSAAQNTFFSDDRQPYELPFSLSLSAFEVDCYPGTNTPLNYRSVVFCGDAAEHQISMNKVLKINSFRFYQLSYDPDLRGSTLMVNHDPVGIALSYSGYMLLAVAFIWVLLNPKGRFRAILKRLRTAAAVVLFAVATASCTTTSSSLPTLFGCQAAEKADSILVLYNGRLVPLVSYATDFSLKLTESRGVSGFSPMQMLFGFACFPDVWQSQPIIKNESILLAECSDGNDYISVKQLVTPEAQDVFSRYWRDKNVQEAFERATLALSVADGGSLAIFPLPQAKEKIEWLAAVDSLQFAENKEFVASFWQNLRSAITEQDFEKIDNLFGELNSLQHNALREHYPPSWRVRLELFVSQMPIISWLWKAALACGLLLVVLGIVLPNKTKKISRLSALILSVLALLQFVNLTFRGLISGQWPLATGYETMLFLALIISFLGVFARKFSPILSSTSVLLVGFALLVADLGLRNPAITPLMPVLHSPWLSVHVAAVMMAYALLSLSFINSLLSVCCRSLCERQMDISLAFVYPATAFLAIGIFVGAVWANESWGRYWAWDPKEVWALITLLVYVVPLHPSLIGRLAAGKALHIYIICAFSTVIMTYFGVNFLLGGMHSYGG